MLTATSTEIVRGKTKAIEQTDDPTCCRVVSFDDTTAGDGKRHELIPGKGRLSTRTTCSIFRYLRRQGIPVAYKRDDSSRSFLAQYCMMVPLEIVGRFRVDPKGSYLKRNPHLQAGDPIDPPVIEYYLKTTGRQWRNVALPCDDPYLEWRKDGTFAVYLPGKPVKEQSPLMAVSLEELDLDSRTFEDLRALAGRVNTVLKQGFDAVGAVLSDFKWEAGFNTNGQLLVADVIDGDSLRATYQGRDISKQPFRDGADIATVKEGFEILAHLTDNLPRGVMCGK